MSVLSINGHRQFPGTLTRMDTVTRRRFSLLLPFVLAATLLLTSGCVGRWNTRHHQASSVVQFLYPGKDQPFIQPSKPTLRLPLRVAVAFVPSSTGNYAGSDVVNSTFTEAQKTELMRDIAAKFRALPFVQSIELVPTTYLRPGGSFENLDQIRALMGVDVIALVAYDQSQLTSDTAWSLSYWTIVGAYVIPARKNDTATLMEAVVYDIPSRSLLFRAPGVSTIHGNSTPINSDGQLQNDSKRGYIAAAEDLTNNLQHELDAFKVRARQEPEAITIEHKPGFSLGGGTIGSSLALLLTGLVAVRLLAKNRIFQSRPPLVSIPLSSSKRRPADSPIYPSR